MVRRRDAGFRFATFWNGLSLISSISVMVMSPLGGVPEVGGYYHGSGCLLGSSCCPVMFGSSWSG